MNTHVTLQLSLRYSILQIQLHLMIYFFQILFYPFSKFITILYLEFPFPHIFKINCTYKCLATNNNFYCFTCYKNVYE